jgi:hypothetical protein
VVFTDAPIGPFRGNAISRGPQPYIRYATDRSATQDPERFAYYSAGTQLVARTLADLGVYGRFMDQAEIRSRAKLGNVILVGSDVDRHVLSGYLLDGALRVPRALTVYQSSADSALELSRRVFRRNRAVHYVKRLLSLRNRPAPPTPPTPPPTA